MKIDWTKYSIKESEIIEKTKWTLYNNKEIVGTVYMDLPKYYIVKKDGNEEVN